MAHLPVQAAINEGHIRLGERDWMLVDLRRQLEAARAGTDVQVGFCFQVTKLPFVGTLYLNSVAMLAMQKSNVAQDDARRLVLQMVAKSRRHESLQARLLELEARLTPALEAIEQACAPEFLLSRNSLKPTWMC